MKKKLLNVLLGVAFTAAFLVGCSGSKTEETVPETDGINTEEATVETEAVMTEDTMTNEEVIAEGGSVYYFNFKPEQDEAWQKLAAAYTEETGVEVTVVTTEGGQYESTLMSKMGESQAPTLFQINGPIGLSKWRDYCYDLSDTEIYRELTNEDFALKEGDAVYAIGYVIESYGLITNKTLLEKAGYEVTDICSFEDLQKCAKDITARSSELGFSAFTSAGLDDSAAWRFKTHLANLPIYFEYQDDGISSTAAIKGTYLDEFRAIWDLYINNSTCSTEELVEKTGDDAREEFLNGEAVFFQNGSWEYGNLTGEDGFTDEELVMIPIYIGVKDEENQGLCTGTENYWCVNSQVSKADIQATVNFINWCVTSETGTKAMAADMGFVIPFKAAAETANLFAKQDAAYMAEGKIPVSWDFTTIPGEEWKNGLCLALTAYAADQTDENWAAVVTAFVDGWAIEYSLAN